MAKPSIPERLNICMIATSFPILGRAADHGFLWPIAKGLAEYGHNVTVLAWKNPQGKKEISQDNVNAYFLGASFARNKNDFPFLAKQKFEQLHQSKPFHIVHSIDASGFQIGRQRRRYKVGMAYDIEATEMSRLFSIMAMAQETPMDQIRAGFRVGYGFLKTYFRKDRRILRTADGMFVTSPQQKIILERHYLYPDLKTFVIPYGLEVGDLSPREKSEELRKTLGLPEGATTVVTITDMQELGELKNLLRAFEKVAIKKPRARLIIVGDGPLRKQVEWEMLNLALGSRVVFAGPVSNVELPDYISIADAYVDISSRTSGFEPSMIEAMAQNKVIVGSELSPISTLVEDGVDGFLVRPADTNFLGNLLIKIFDHEVPSQQIGQQASKKVHNLFDTKKMVQQTLGAYQKTLETTGFYRTPWHFFA